MTLKQQLEIVMAHQLASRVVEAENICEEILRQDLEQPDAIHLLYLIRAEQDKDRDEEAVVLMEKALKLLKMIRFRRKWLKCASAAWTLTRVLLP